MPTPDQPQKQAYYFSHDSNARNDIKIVKLRRKLGMEGYGIYWSVIEILREEADHKMLLTSIEDISFQIGVDAEKVNDVIKSFGLFQIDDSKFYSDRLIRSMEAYNETKTRLSAAGKRGMQKRWHQDQPTAPPLKRIQ